MTTEPSKLSKSLSDHDLWQHVKLLEEKRKLRSNTVYLRNKAYWKELVNYQREGFEDAQELLSFMKDKQAMLLQYGRLLKQSERHSPIAHLHSNPLPSPGHEPSKRKSAGYLAKKAFTTLDECLSKLVLEIASSIEKEIVQTFVDKLTIYEQEVERLSEHAKLLFVAWILLDGRVASCYERLQQAVQGPHPMPAQRSSPRPSTALPTSTDKWILYMRYCVSVQKFDLLMHHCFLKFRMLFKLAREMEASRVHIVTRSSGEIMALSCTICCC